jgi:hypothetical protein
VPVSEEDGKATGLGLGKWVVLFGRKGMVEGDLSYQAPPGATRHLILDAVRNARYVLSGAGGKRELTASAEGVLDFRTAPGARVTLDPEGEAP